MAKITEQPTKTPDASEGLAAEALRAEAWAGEPFLRPDEEVETVLAPGTSRRAALDDAISEIDAGRRSPSPQWKVQWGLMLGLERVLADPEPHLASGTTLRRHQIDALAGMLTELIAAHRQADRRSGIRRGGPRARRPDPHAPPAARRPVPARPHRGGLRRPDHAGDPQGQGKPQGRSAHDPDLRLVRAPRRRGQPRRLP